MSTTVVGSNDTIGTTDGVSSDTLILEGNNTVVGSGDTIDQQLNSMSTTVVGSNDTIGTTDAAAWDTVYLQGNDTVDNSNETIDQQLNSMRTTVVGSNDTIGTTDGASSDTLFLEGNNTVDGSGDTIDQQLNSMSTTVVGSNDTIGTTDGAAWDTLYLQGNDTVDNSYETIDQQLGSMTTTVVGSNDTIGTTDNAAHDIVDFGNNATDDTLDGSDDTINAGRGSFTLDGNGDTFHGAADDSLSVSGQSDTIYLNNATVDVSGDDSVTIDGSDDKIVGGASDAFTIDGTGDDISATSSSVVFDGSDAGDDISGSGDTWSDPDDGGGDGGYYGYGLTSWQGRGVTAAQMAAAHKKSGGSGSVYENASWADKTVTWSFASASGSSAITDIAEQAAVEQAFQAWAAASGLTFEEASAGTASDIEVGFGELNTATSNTIGLTHYTYAGGELQAGVQVQLENPGQASLTTDASGQLMYASTGASFEQVALHEIGHALGLADNDTAGSIMNMVLGTSNSTLDAADVANIQALYSGSMASTSSSGSGIPAQSAAQLHQLLQAIASFDAGSGGADAAVPSLQDLTQTGSLSIGPSQAHLTHAV
jgi:predicted Zn-dependent protease